VSHVADAPRAGTELRANLFWLGDRHLAPGRPYVLKLATQEIPCAVAGVSGVINTATLGYVEAHEVAKNEVATVTLSLKAPVAYDCFTDIVETGRFVLVDGYDVAGGGIVLPPVENDFTI